MFCNACVPYIVRVNGYTKGESLFLKGKKILVYRNEKAINYFLENEIAAKITNAVKMNGYTAVDQLEDADYVLLFNYGIDQGNTYSRTYSVGGTQLNIYTGQLAPTTSVGSTTETEYHRFLLMNLFEANGLSEGSKPVWVGEINSRGSSADLRNVIDYLILGAFEHFGANTVQQKRHDLFETDPRLKTLYESSQ